MTSRYSSRDQKRQKQDQFFESQSANEAKSNNCDFLSEFVDDLNTNSIKSAILSKLLERSRNQLSQEKIKEIQQLQKQLENQVYWRYSENKQQYLNHLLNELMTDQHKKQLREQRVEKDIIDGAEQVEKKKNVSKYDLLSVNQEAYFKQTMQRKYLLTRQKFLQSSSDAIIIKTGDEMNSQSVLNQSNSQIAIFNEQQNLINEQKQLEVHNFLSKLQQEKIQRQQMIKELQKSEELKQNTKLLQDQEQHKLLQQQQHQQALEEFKRQQDLIKKRKEERERQQAEFQQFFKEFKKSKPLFSILEEDYINGKVLPALEEKKKKLSEIREIYRPHTKQEFVQHLQWYNQMVDQLMVHRQETRESFLSTLKNKHYWRGRSHKMVEEEMKATHQTNPLEEKQQLRDRQKKYAELVKQEYKPSIDEEKVEQINQQIQNSQKYLKKKTILRYMKNEQASSAGSKEKLIENQALIEKEEIDFKPLSDVEQRHLGHQYMEFSKKQIDKQQNKLQVKDVELEQAKKPNTSDQPIYQSKYEDYLKSQKQQRHSLHRASLDTWKKEWDNNELDQQEKIQRILIQTSKLDVSAQRKEQIIRNSIKSTDPISQVKEKGELDDVYVNSIKAKLAILQQCASKQ